MKNDNLVSQLSAEIHKTVSGNLTNIAKTSLSTSFRKYMKDRDTAYFREMEKKKKSDLPPVGNHLLRDNEERDNYSEFEIPTVFSRIDTARSRLDSMFISSSPIFK